MPCDFSPVQPPSESPITTTVCRVDGDAQSVNPRRGRARGRPRKDWTQSPLNRSETAVVSGLDTVSTRQSSAAASDSHLVACTLNIADAELLLQFNSSTALTFADTDDSNNSIGKFWANNVPQIGLSYHFVLHLAFAVAGYHLAHLQAGEGQRQHYKSLADRHISVGLAEFSKALSKIDSSNCGALYVSAVLVCYCTFAAGPIGPDDLLVCYATDEKPHWMSLVHGVRLIRSTMDSTTLFSGLMAPLGPTSEPSMNQKPTFIREGFSRIDWEEPLYKLRNYISTCYEPDMDIYLQCCNDLLLIYEATYGKDDGSYDISSDNQFIFAWLYRLDDRFVSCLRRKRPLALLLLAYYCVLLKTMEKLWFMAGWSDHIVGRVRHIIGTEFGIWLKWPIEQVGLS